MQHQLLNEQPLLIMVPLWFSLLLSTIVRCGMCFARYYTRAEMYFGRTRVTFSFNGKQCVPVVSDAQTHLQRTLLT
jgi:hypothetical protein